MYSVNTGGYTMNNDNNQHIFDYKGTSFRGEHFLFHQQFTIERMIDNCKSVKEATEKILKHIDLRGHRSLRYIPNRYINKEMCILAINISCHNIKYVPKRYLTRELCEYAFSISSECIIDIPVKYITKEMCETHIKMGSRVSTLCDIPKSLRTYKLCKLAISTHYLNILHVPKKYLVENDKELIKLNMLYWGSEHTARSVKIRFSRCDCPK